MELIYTALGSFILFGLFIGGGFAGFALRGYLDKRTIRKVEDTRTEEQRAKERKQLIEQQDAFRVMQNYSTERAYGMIDDHEVLTH